MVRRGGLGSVSGGCWNSQYVSGGAEPWTGCGNRKAPPLCNPESASAPESARPDLEEKINLTFRLIRSAKLTRPKQAKGLTRKYLERFLAIQPNNPWSLRNKTMLSLDYDLMTCRSELVALTTEDLHWRGDGTLRVISRRSKADPFGQGRIAFTWARFAKLLEQWLEWRRPGIAPLFCPIYQSKAINRDLSTSTVTAASKIAPCPQRTSLACAAGGA